MRQGRGITLSIPKLIVLGSLDVEFAPEHFDFNGIIPENATFWKNLREHGLCKSYVLTQIRCGMAIKPLE